jgi:hypothetical protein
VREENKESIAAVGDETASKLSCSSTRDTFYGPRKRKESWKLFDLLNNNRERDLPNGIRNPDTRSMAANALRALSLKRP